MVLMSVMLGASCSEGVTGPNGGQPTAAVVPFTEGIRIGWDYRTRQRLFDGPASYPRMIRLQSGRLLSSVESVGKSYVLISDDNGATWSAPVEAASAAGDVIAAVPSLVQLESGAVLLAYNTRPPRDNTDASRRFGIKIVASHDGGQTWQPWADVFEGGYTWGRGVWEPAMIQLESGEVLLFFANEYPYEASDDQEISVVRSRDDGRTWTAPQTVSYRAGHRDGMPVPLLLQDDERIALAIEDDGLVPGPFKPVVVQLRADSTLGREVIGADSPQRQAALADAARLPVSAYGGAPYLAQLPSGETLLSFQSNEGREGDWAHSTMVVTLGDAGAQAFDRKSYPFRVPEGRRALWNALFVKDSSTVTALSSTDAFNASHPELYVIDGHVIVEPVARHGAVTVDGEGTESAWTQSTDLFVGAYSDRVTRARTAWDAEKLYLRFEVVDGNASAEAGDAVLVALAPRVIAEDMPVEGAYKLRVEADGAAYFYEGRGGTWEPAEAAGVAVSISDSTSDAPGMPGGQRYVAEVALPWKQVGGRPSVGAAWGLNVGLVNRNARGEVTREWASGTRADRPTTWLKMVLEN